MQQEYERIRKRIEEIGDQIGQEDDGSKPPKESILDEYNKILEDLETNADKDMDHDARKQEN